VRLKYSRSPLTFSALHGKNRTRSIIITLLLALMEIVNLLRSRYGDMNCQKLFGCSTSLYGLLSTIMSLIQFRGNCGLLNSVFVFPWASKDTLEVFVAKSGTVGVVDVVLR